MPEFDPVTTLPDLFALDGQDVVDGYMAGYRGEPEPLASVFSRAYVHGWRNGAADGGHRSYDAAQRILAASHQAAQHWQ